MDMHASSNSCSSAVMAASDQEEDLRRGPWTVEEDLVLMNYIAAHGEGRWNSLARSAGLKRTGKSCRLRWLNYLRPDVRRGNITPEEQLLILELHSRWGNRWSKIAQHLPGRTDNEIKNYWRTRVQKHAKQLRCDVNSKQFKDIMKYLWMPRLVERIHASSGNSSAAAIYQNVSAATNFSNSAAVQSAEPVQVKLSPETSSTTAESSLESLEMQFTSTPVSESFAGSYSMQGCNNGEEYRSYNCGENWLQDCQQQLSGCWPEMLSSTGGCAGLGLSEFEQVGGWGDNSWSVEDIWLQQQF